MASETEKKTFPRETQLIPLDVKGKLVAYSFHMKKQKIAKQKYLIVLMQNIASPFKCKRDTYNYMRLLHE